MTSRTPLTTRMAMAARTAYLWRPMPASIPMEAVAQSPAAVVSPLTCSPLRTMLPAPRKPMPVMIFPATAPELSQLREAMAKIADPRATRALVRIPMSFE